MIDYLEALLAGTVILIGAILAACGVVIVATLATAWFILRVAAQYFAAMLEVIDEDMEDAAAAKGSYLGLIARVERHKDQERTYPEYFFGQVEVDMKGVINATAHRIARAVTDGWASGVGMMEDIPGVVVGAGVCAGTAVGGAGGALLASVVGLIHVIIVIAASVIAAAMAMILRGVDTAMRFLAGVRMTCPVCALAVRPYAAYKCPSCEELHRDVRPGRRGVVGRICKCGDRLPTLLLFGAYRLTAMCPRCGARLPARFGKTPEIVVPFFGSVKAGKTQLIYTLVLALEVLVKECGGTVITKSDTRQELERIGNLLSASGNPGPTLPRSPEAFVLTVKLGPHERLIYLFDAAGELHYRDVGLDELRYLDKASTLVYVADPLAAEGIWERLSEGRQDELAEIRSNAAEAELAYELPREQIRRMGGKARLMRLAFVVSKGDVIPDRDALSNHNAVRKLIADSDGLDMGNLVREAERSFGTVGYFATAAVRDEAGSPDDSVTELATWLLNREGIRFEAH
ncbi:MAG TPA: hypothetical protein VF070_16710 [Streptosporangiaceae bacterium]